MASEKSYPDTSADSGRTGKCKSGFAIAGGKISGSTYATKPCDAG